MPDLPRGFHPKAHGGISRIRHCDDCVLPDHQQWYCPAVELMKEAGIRPFRKMYKPTEPQNDLAYAEAEYAHMKARAGRLMCLEKRLFLTAEQEYRDMLSKERRG